MKFGEILMCYMTNISNIFLVPCRRLDTSARPFYDFIKILKQRDLAIFNSGHLQSLIVSYSAFQKNVTLESWHNWLLSNQRRLLNCKGPGTLCQSPKLFKKFLKIIVLVYIYQLAMFGNLMSCGSKNILKNAPCLVY